MDCPIDTALSFVIAATEHLHKRIARMSDRIRQLEDGLAVLQSAHSKEQHPLLHDSQLLVEHDKAPEDTGAGSDEEGESTSETLTAFGTMSISEHGQSRFFGPTGGSEGLLLVRVFLYASIRRSKALAKLAGNRGFRTWCGRLQYIY